MPGALHGVRVLDCTQIIAGPLSAALLSEMGADVVKVEPLEGEPWRLQAEIIPKESRNFLVQNRGKRGLAIDLKHPEAASIREDLIRWADVLITNYRPGVAETLGLDYPSVRAVNPRIIYAENTAFGPEGPDAMRRGYDIVAQAMSGVATSNPHVERGQPQIVAFAPADVVTGVALAWAISAALFHRERTGEGQQIAASLLSTALFLQAGSREISAMDIEPRQAKLDHLLGARARGADIQQIYDERRAMTPELIGNIYYRLYQTNDGYIAVGCLGPGPRERFRAALEIHDPRYEPGFEHTPENIRRVGDELVAKCEAIFRTRSTAEWRDFLDGYDIACGPLRFIEELYEDPQVAANGYLVDYEHPLLGPMRGPAPIVRMSATPTAVQRSSPALGENTDEVLETLGLPAERIAELHAKNVVG